MTTQYTIEAEELDLTGYTVKTNSDDASGDGYVQTWGTGEASTVFNGEPGTYTFNLDVFDENDGQSTIDVIVNGVVVATVTLDQDDGGGWINGTHTTITVEGIELQAGDALTFRGTRDAGEPARFDSATLVQTGQDFEVGETITLLSETFENISWGNIVSNDYNETNNAVQTNGNDDGVLLTRSVDLEGFENTQLSFDASHISGSFEELGTSAADFLRVELVDQDGNVIVLDTFSGSGNTLVGSQTGQVIDPSMDQLTYDLPEGLSSAQIRFVSDISAGGEVLQLDNLRLTADVAPEPIVLDVQDDTHSVGETEDVAANVFDNDMLGEGVTITALEHDGQSFNVGDSFAVTTDSGRTGTVTVEADGSFSFDGGDNFVELAEGETDSFQLTYTASTPETTASSTRVIDFEGFAAGDVISNQIAGVTISAQRNGDGAGSANDAMIFDSFNPTGGDDDLATASNGNLLIISEDNDSSDPDDNAGGGSISIDFDEAEDLQQITFIDTEEGSATITLTLADGSTQTLMGPQTLNGHVGVFNIGVANVVSMTISLVGSGAIDDIVLADTVSVPGASDTATITVVVNGENALMDGDEAISVGENDTNVDLGNVLDNTTDPEPGQPDVTAVNGVAADVATQIAGSNGGVFTINADGTASFDTNGEFEALGNGDSTTSSITYDVTDAAGDTVTSTYTVTINGENDLADAGEALTVDEDAGAVDLDNVLDNTVDPETGDPVVTAVAGDGAGVGAQVAGSNGGVFTINADGTASFDTNGEFDGLNDGDSAVTSITYDVTDAAGDTVTSTYTVTVNGKGSPEPETEFVDLSGTIITEAPGKTAVAVIIDTSFTALSQVNGVLVEDLNGDARINTVVDLFLSKVIDLAATMDADQHLGLIPAGQDSAGPVVEVTAGDIMAANAEGLASLQALFASINDNALDNTIDLDLALLEAESYLTGAGADANDVLVLTSTDGFDIATFNNVSDPAATVDRLTDDHGLDADIDVVLIENGYFADTATLDAIDTDGLADDITFVPAFGLDQLVDYAPTVSAGDVLEISVNGVTQSVADEDPATEGFQWSFDDLEIELGATPTVLVGIDQDGDGTIASHEQVDVSDVLVRDGDSFSFELDAFNPPAQLDELD